MGEHPSPGPAVAACAEAERIEELEPEAEERPPAAPEDVSTPSPARANFLGGAKGRAALRSPPAGQLGGFKVTRERPGLAGSPRAERGGGTGLPETRARHPPLGLPGLPCGTQRPPLRRGLVGRRSPLPAAGAVPGTRRFPAEAAASQQ